MTRPTDDELEAIAAKLDRNGPSHVDADILMSEAAAMLRACKTGDALEPAPDHADWNAALEAAAQAVPSGWCQPSTSHIEMDVDLGQGIQEAIRQLKKGQTND